MNSIAISDILVLPIQDRIQLVEAIWDSIAEVPEAVVLSDSQRHELDRRLAAYQENPSLGSPWSEVRPRISKA
jgi:putative addiction module component (TIGR02574 family)